jgi:hypothetical protein
MAGQGEGHELMAGALALELAGQRLPRARPLGEAVEENEASHGVIVP